MSSNYFVKPSLQKSFWNFSLNLYDNPTIEEACAALQERYQININLVFFCCWLSKENFRALTPEELEAILVRVTPWNRRIILGVVALSKLMKRYRNRSSWIQLNSVVELEKKVHENKRFADKVEQSLMLPAIRHLEKQTIDDANKMNVALTNVFSYINTQKISIHQNDLEKIYRIVKTCFSE